MNGCCRTNADSRHHDSECALYWPCGCEKVRGVFEHTHKYVDQRPPRHEKEDDEK